jgi:hypothetical protein
VYDVSELLYEAASYDEFDARLTRAYDWLYNPACMQGFSLEEYRCWEALHFCLMSARSTTMAMQRFEREREREREAAHDAEVDRLAELSMKDFGY